MAFSADLSLTHNARELGGLPTIDGGVVASGVLFRSDALAGLTDVGLRAFADHRIGTVVDLRTDGERARSADLLPADGSVALLTVPVLGGAMDELVRKLLPTAGGGASLSAGQLAAIADQVPTLEDLYIAILRSSAPQFVQVARAVLDAADTERPGVLFHCTAGKDRTGVAAALLLLVAGVPREAIVEDYVRTEANLAGGLADALKKLITSLGVPLTPRLEILATRSPASAIEAALDWIAEEHGDVSGYLATGGMTTVEIETLRRVLRGERTAP